MKALCAILLISLVVTWSGVVLLLTCESDAARLQFQPPTVAIIDLERAFDESQNRDELEKEIQREFKSKYHAFENLEKELTRLKKELVLVVEGSDEYRKLQKSILYKGVDLKFSEEELKRDLNAKKNKAFGRVYEVIYRTTREYARSRGINLILQRQLTIQPGSPPWESIFYFDPALDVTNDIIALVNGK